MQSVRCARDATNPLRAAAKALCAVTRPTRATQRAHHLGVVAAMDPSSSDLDLLGFDDAAPAPGPAEPSLGSDTDKGEGEGEGEGLVSGTDDEVEGMVEPASVDGEAGAADVDCGTGTGVARADANLSSTAAFGHHPERASASTSGSAAAAVDPAPTADRVADGSKHADDADGGTDTTTVLIELPSKSFGSDETLLGSCESIQLLVRAHTICPGL